MQTTSPLHCEKHLIHTPPVAFNYFQLPTHAPFLLYEISFIFVLGVRSSFSFLRIRLSKKPQSRHQDFPDAPVRNS